MSSQTDAHQLLAIALLNYADDDGLFYADPDLIRGAIAPRKASSEIHGLISDLSLQGYLILGKHKTHGLIGKIVAFADHQVINRPKPSKIKDLWQSLIDHGLISDPSLLEGKGREGKGKDKRGFQKPSSDEIAEYGKTVSKTFTDHQRFHDFYESKGWQVGTTPMADWKSALRNWIRRDEPGAVALKKSNAEKNGY